MLWVLLVRARGWVLVVLVTITAGAGVSSCAGHVEGNPPPIVAHCRPAGDPCYGEVRP